jgi:hypothetical protein
MKKSVLERYISKYNLAGSVESVTLTADTKGVSTRFISDDRNVIGEVNTTLLTIDDGNYAIYETQQLKSLLNVLDEDVTLKVNKSGAKNISITLSDDKVKTNFVLASEDNIPKVPLLKKLPTFNIVTTIDKMFVERFVRAKNALPDVETFTVTSDGKSVDIVIGHSKMNTNRVSIGVTATTVDKIDPINFHARYLKDILVANKEAESGTLEVSSDGMARVTFIIPDFKVTYYLPEIKIED